MCMLLVLTELCASCWRLEVQEGVLMIWKATHEALLMAITGLVSRKVSEKPSSSICRV